MSPLVERVTNSFPQVQRTVACAYSGWMSVFMVDTSVGPRTSSACDTERVVLLVGLVDVGPRVHQRFEPLAAHAARAGEEDVDRRAGCQRDDARAADQGAVAQERHVEPARGFLAAVHDDR